MAVIPGGVPVGGFFSPTDDSDTYATHDSLYGKGGFKEVSDLTARNAISTDRRREGVMAYVAADQKTYQLVGGITDGNWTEFSSGFSDPMTTRGDLIYRDSSNVTNRLVVGTVGQVLTSDGTDVSWDNLPTPHDAVTLAASATTGGLSLSTQEIGFQAATGAQNGYLTSADWTTFNSKSDYADVMTTRGDIIYRDSSNITNRLGIGTSAQVLTSDGTDVSWSDLPATHNAVTLAVSATTSGLSLSTQEIGFQAATGAQNGYLTSTDWTTFNSKSDYVDPLTTDGDLLYRNTTTTRLPVGTEGQTLTVSSGLPAWSDAASSVGSGVYAELNYTNSGSNNIGTAVPDNTAIYKLIVEVTTSFDGTTPTLEIGDAGDADRHVITTDVDLTTVGIYITDVLYNYTSSTQITATITVSGATQGAATILGLVALTA